MAARPPSPRAAWARAARETDFAPYYSGAEEVWGIEKETDRQRDRQRQRETGRERQAERDRDRDRQRQRPTETERERETETETEAETESRGLTWYVSWVGVEAPCTLVVFGYHMPTTDVNMFSPPQLPNLTPSQ